MNDKIISFFNEDLEEVFLHSIAISVTMISQT